MGVFWVFSLLVLVAHSTPLIYHTHQQPSRTYPNHVVFSPRPHPIFQVKHPSQASLDDPPQVLLTPNQVQKLHDFQMHFVNNHLKWQQMQVANFQRRRAICKQQRLRRKIRKFLKRSNKPMRVQQEKIVVHDSPIDPMIAERMNTHKPFEWRNSGKNRQPGWKKTIDIHRRVIIPSSHERHIDSRRRAIRVMTKQHNHRMVGSNLRMNESHLQNPMYRYRNQAKSAQKHFRNIQEQRQRQRQVQLQMQNQMHRYWQYVIRKQARNAQRHIRDIQKQRQRQVQNQVHKYWQHVIQSQNRTVHEQHNNVQKQRRDIYTSQHRSQLQRNIQSSMQRKLQASMIKRLAEQRIRRDNQKMVKILKRQAIIKQHREQESLQALAVIEMIFQYGERKAYKVVSGLYPAKAQKLISSVNIWQQQTLQPWTVSVLKPAIRNGRFHLSPPPIPAGVTFEQHQTWLLAYLHKSFGFRQALEMAHSMYGSAGVQRLWSIESWKRNVLGPWRHKKNVQPAFYRFLLMNQHRQQLANTWYQRQLLLERSKVHYLKQQYDRWMRREQVLLEDSHYKKFLETVIGKDYFGFLDKNHTPYYLFLSREMRKWIYRQHNLMMRNERQRWHIWRLRHDHRYRAHYQYIKGVFPVLHSIITSRKPYWAWHHRMHRRVWRAHRWHADLRRIKRSYPYQYIPYRILNGAYLRYIEWVRRLNPFDRRHPLNPFNRYYGLMGGPNSRPFMSWLRSLRGVPRWYWRTHPMKYGLPRGFRRWPHLFRILPRYRRSPWYLRRPFKFDPRFNPYWPYYRAPKLPRLPYPFHWPKFRRPHMGRLRLPMTRWPFRRPHLRIPRLHRPYFGLPTPRFRPRWPLRAPRFRFPYMPYMRWPRLHWPRWSRPRLPRFYIPVPRFRLPRFGWSFRVPRFPRFHWPWYYPRNENYDYYYY